MANDNHEFLNGIAISTYTDAITSENPMSESDVYSCILSAGIPYERSMSAWMKNETSASLNEPNSNNPWENGPTGVGVIHNTSALIEVPTDNPENYFKIMYGTSSVNATELSVKKYRNVLNITPLTTTLKGQTITYYSWSITTQYGENNSWNDSALAPFRIVIAGGKPCKMPVSGDHNVLYGYSEFSAFGGRNSTCHYDYNIASATDGTTNQPANAPYYKNSDWDYELQSETDVQIYNDTYFTRYLQGVNYGGGGGFHSYGVILITNIDYILMLCALCGLKFRYNGTDYKPLVSGGVVTGYTSDMTETSEWDEWKNIGDHVIPVSPPSPPVPEEDESDDQSWGGAYSGAGAFSKFYLCTATDLANLRTWFGGGGTGDQIPDGFDPMGQVLGLLQYPVSISGTALAPEEIVFRSGKTIIRTGVNADRSTGGFLHLDCGSVEIPRRMQQRGVPFLDFETTLEIYVPFCGTAPLDVQTCVGKTLTCDMYVATATGDVSAVIAAGGHPVAYMSGNMAESLPISSAGYGMYLAACKSTWGNGVSQVMNQLTGGTTDTLKNVNQAALNETLSYNQTGGWGRSELIAESYNNPKIGSAMAAAAGPMGAAAIGLIKTGLNVMNAATTGYEQYQRVKHASYTSVSGSFTSCAAWNYPFTPYVKITRPLKQIPNNYKHTAAIPLVETKTLSGAPGLTTCVNPDVSGIANATAQEKDIIYRALVNGVIV